MATSSFLPKIMSDGALVGYQLLDIEISTSSTEVPHTDYKPNHLISKIKQYVTYIVNHLRILEEEIKERLEEEEKKLEAGLKSNAMAETHKLRAIQKILSDAINIQEKIICYSPDLYYGVTSENEFFVDFQSGQEELGSGRKIFKKNYDLKPTMPLPFPIAYTLYSEDETYVYAYQALVALYELYLAAREALFEIKELQLQNIQIALKNKKPLEIDTFCYDFPGVPLTCLTPENLNRETYKALIKTAEDLETPCKEFTRKLQAKRLKNSLPPSISYEQMIQEKLYLHIKKIVDQNPKATRGVANLYKIIYATINGKFTPSKLKKILEEGEASSDRRFLCMFTPGRTLETKRFYQTLAAMKPNEDKWVLNDKVWIKENINKVEQEFENYFKYLEKLYDDSKMADAKELKTLPLKK